MTLPPSCHPHTAAAAPPLPLPMLPPVPPMKRRPRAADPLGDPLGEWAHACVCFVWVRACVRGHRLVEYYLPSGCEAPHAAPVRLRPPARRSVSSVAHAARDACAVDDISALPSPHSDPPTKVVAAPSLRGLRRLKLRHEGRRCIWGERACERAGSVEAVEGSSLRYGRPTGRPEWASAGA